MELHNVLGTVEEALAQDLILKPVQVAHTSPRVLEICVRELIKLEIVVAVCGVLRVWALPHASEFQ